MRPSASKTTRVLSPFRVKAAIGCLDMAKAFYKGAKVDVCARKLSEDFEKTALAAAPMRKKNFEFAGITFENGPAWRAQNVRKGR